MIKLLILIVFLIICYLFLILFYFFENKSNNKSAFCLLTREPHTIWLDFLTTFKNYDTYVVIDNQNDYTEIKKKYPNITFVQISDEECNYANYVNSDYFLRKNIVATDKAYYYFNRINPQYDYIWFCEDDVFFYNENTLISIDEKYKSTDLIVPDLRYYHEDSNWMHWHDIDNRLEKPWAHSLICLTRFSKNLMKELDIFIIKNKKLIFKEILFHTLCLHNNMKIATPEELKNIIIDKDWMINEINKNNCYHQVKNLEHHLIFRNNL